jgi:sucrose phosphorylase
LKLLSGGTTFFNFLASHDGIGMNPVRGILSESQIENIVAQCVKHGGLVSYKQNTDGTESPYELNINYFDALSDPAGSDAIDLQVDRFLAAHFILLSLIGVPAIYFHSLFGSRSWSAGPAATGRNRSINRQKLLRAEVESELKDPGSLRCKVFNRLRKLLRVRALHAAFNPYGSQQVVDLGESVFAVYRNSPDEGERILCLQNVSSESQTLTLSGMSPVIDLLNPDIPIEAGAVHLAPYQGSWFVNAANRRP